MIVDCHVHIFDKKWISNRLWDQVARTIANQRGLELDYVMRTVMPGFWNTTPDELISVMDEDGIDVAILLPHDLGLALGEAQTTIEEQNRAFAKATERFPKRLISFVGVDPRRGKAAIDLFVKGVTEWGMAGLKLHPTAGFYPDDERFYTLYEKCVEFNVPLLCHTGATFGPLKSKFCQPVYLDAIAADFPDLKIVVGHSGLGWWEEAMSLALLKPNIYLEISYWQVFLKSSPLYLYRFLRTACDVLGSQQLLFGSDWPGTSRMFGISPGQWRDLLREPPPLVKNAGIQFTDEEISRITGENASRILKL